MMVGMVCSIAVPRRSSSLSSAGSVEKDSTPPDGESVSPSVHDVLYCSFECELLAINQFHDGLQL